MRNLLVSVCLGVLAATPAHAQRTSVGGSFPIYDNGGKPDLTIDPQRFVAQMEIVDRYFAPDDCAIAEGVVGGSGYRRLLRFDTVIMNMGGGDLVVGDRSDPMNPYAQYFVFHSCHGHYHIQNFSEYDLLNTDGTPAAVGVKQGFCMEDNFKYGPNKSNGYDCAYQGITSGWGDWYYKQLVGQWIDITGVPAGEYIVRITINSAGIFDEGDNRYPNAAEVRVVIPKPRNKVN